MRTEALILIGVGLFFGVVGVIYWFTSYEDAGGLMLMGTCFLGLLPGSYYYFWYRRTGPRLEDQEGATIEEGAGEIDAFPNSSVWPFVFGMGAFLLILSLVFGIWLAFPAIVAIFGAVIGITAESRRGGHI